MKWLIALFLLCLVVFYGAQPTRPMPVVRVVSPALRWYKVIALPGILVRLEVVRL